MGRASSFQRAAEGADSVRRFHLQPDNREQCSKQNGGAGGREPVKLKHGGIGCSLADHWRHTGNQFIEVRHRNIDHPLIQRATRCEQGFKRRDTPQCYGSCQEQERCPGHVTPDPQCNRCGPASYQPVTPPKSPKRNTRTGCQRLRNSVRQSSDTSEEIMSGSSGPMKLELRY